MAYYSLAYANYNLENTEASDAAIKRAKALSLKTTKKERLYIEADYAGEWRRIRKNLTASSGR